LLRDSSNVQIPLAKKFAFYSFFRKAAGLWNTLPVAVKSASFSYCKLRLETFYYDRK